MTDAELIARLRMAGESASKIGRQMAEAKSLRQPDNTEGRTDLYMWPKPEDTLEAKAATRLSVMREALERIA